MHAIFDLSLIAIISAFYCKNTTELNNSKGKKSLKTKTWITQDFRFSPRQLCHSFDVAKVEWYCITFLKYCQIANFFVQGFIIDWICTACNHKFLHQSFHQGIKFIRLLKIIWKWIFLKCANKWPSASLWSLDLLPN